jgi:putative sigma-54 modulation protein
MEITIEPANFNASPELLEHAEKALGKLIKYHDQIVSMDVYLKSSKEDPENSKEAELKVFLPGKDVFMSEKAESFPSVIQQLFDKAKNTLSDEKDQDKSKHQPNPFKNI